MRRLDPKGPAEIVVVAFEYTDDMEAGESIVGAAVSCTVAQGTDATPAAMLDGAAAIVGLDVQQRVTGGVLGNTYRLHCLATLSSGRRLELAALLPIRQA